MTDEEIRRIPLWARRAGLVIGVPITIAINFVSRTWRELRTLPGYWRADIRETLAEARFWWRRQ